MIYVCNSCKKNTKNSDEYASKYFCHHCDTWNKKGKPLKVVTLAMYNEEYDGTDYASPSWWRGNDSGVEKVTKIVNDILDDAEKGKPATGGYGSRDLQSLRERLIKLVKQSRERCHE